MRGPAGVQREQVGAADDVVADQTDLPGLMMERREAFGERLIRRLSTGIEKSLLAHPLEAISDGTARRAIGCEVVLHGIQIPCSSCRLRVL